MLEEDSKKDVAKIIIAGVLLAAAFAIEKCFSIEKWQLLIIYLVPYLIVGFDVLKEAVEKLIHGEFLEEEFLMAVATIGALMIGFLPNTEPMFHEAVFVMLFFKIGELFEEIAEGKSEKSIEDLLSLKPEYANAIVDGEVVKTRPDLLTPGDMIEVYPGEKVPTDGVVIEGSSTVNTAALTGESVPRTINVGEDISSGFINLTSNLKVEVTKPYNQSNVARIIDLVKNAVDNKSKSEKFITKFARVYTPIVVLIAILLAFVPPALTGNFLENFSVWLVRGLTFLVVSCPCALVISVPLAFFGGIGAMSKHGILVKGSNYLEDLSKITNVVFDKTGTLTEGVFEVTAIHPETISEEQLLHLAAHVERYSKHPIAISLKQAFKNEADDCEVNVIEDIAGYGIKAIVNGDEICVGNAKFMKKLGVQHKDCEHTGTIIHVAINNTYAGHIVISDRVKSNAEETIGRLSARGVTSIMLTGDHKDVSQAVADDLGIRELYYELLPEQKVEMLENILGARTNSRKVAFAGDGINDAPVLAKADLGIAMGALGQDAAIEIADIVLMDDDISKIPTAINIAQKTMAIAKQNIFFAIFVKILVLILAALGYAPMWLAVFADVGVTVLAVLNSMRTLRF